MDFNLDRTTIGSYVSNYTPESLINKIRKVAKTAGIKVVYGAMLLYYALLDDNVPLKDKAIVIGALGYFILPLDFIPDFLGVIGYGDDMTVLVYALKTIWDNITPETHNKARARLSDWFDDVKSGDLQLF